MKKIKSISFLSVAVLMGVFFAGTIFADGTSTTSTVSPVALNLDNLSGFGLSDMPIYDIAVNLLNWILAIFGIVGIIGFIISGIMYMLAAGDTSKIETAKKAMTASILGVVVGLSGLVVLYAVQSALSGTAFF